MFSLSCFRTRAGSRHIVAETPATERFMVVSFSLLLFDTLRFQSSINLSRERISLRKSYLSSVQQETISHVMTDICTSQVEMILLLSPLPHTR